MNRAQKGILLYLAIAGGVFLLFGGVGLCIFGIVCFVGFTARKFAVTGGFRLGSVLRQLERDKRDMFKRHRSFVSGVFFPVLTVATALLGLFLAQAPGLLWSPYGWPFYFWSE